MVRKRQLILCPGLLCDDALWAHQVASLGDVAEIVVSEFQTHDSIRSMAESLLASAPPRFAIAGLSLGGYVCQEVMRLAPDRVIGLALLNTSARPDTKDQASRRRSLVERVEKGEFEDVMAMLWPLLVHPERAEDESLRDRYLEMGGHIGGDIFVRHQTAILNRANGVRDLARIKCPTLVLCGREDQVTPLELHLEMAAAIPRADLAVLGRCGHLSTLERPEAVTGILRTFLTERIP